ncbi:MAG: radical SAM protein [Oscillospiraceae bacterium]|nr:radical SAM protein [Oscillospiraceae bacterium]
MRKYNIGWGLTSKCNMNCELCYSKETRNKSIDISIVDWKRFVDENHEQIDSINYGTGENALLDDFFVFIDYARAKYPFIKQSVTTNGFITQRILKNDNYHDIFMRALDEVDISLDFADKRKHCDFRGQQYAYDWAIQTLEHLQGSKIKATIVFVGFEETLKKENIDGLFEIAKEYDTMIRLNIYRPVSEAKEINDKFKLSYKTLFDSLRYINSQYRINRHFDSQPFFR